MPAGLELEWRDVDSDGAMVAVARMWLYSLLTADGDRARDLSSDDMVAAYFDQWLQDGATFGRAHGWHVYSRARVDADDQQVLIFIDPASMPPISGPTILVDGSQVSARAILMQQTSAGWKVLGRVSVPLEAR
jgi:hypothetical protein